MIKHFDGDPHSYIGKKRSIKDNRLTMFCSEYIFDENGKKIYCNYSCRIDHLQEKIRKGIVHKCIFSKPEKETNLDIFLNNKKLDPSLEDNLYNNLIKISGKLNLSLNQSCSIDFYNFIEKCAYFGFEIGTRNESFEIFSQLFPQPKRDTFRKHFIEVANVEHREIMKKYSKLNYISLAIDEGTTLNTKYLDFILINPFISLKPYLSTTRTMNNLGVVEYSNTIIDGLYELDKYKIQVACVVIDGQLAQTKSFSKQYSGSIPNIASKDWIKKIIVAPCLCHKVQNAYKTATKKCEELNHLVKLFRNYGEIILKEKLTHKKCPKHIETRWIYDYDILNFLNKNEKEINQKFTINGFDKMNPVIFELLPALRIFKSMSQIFESDQSSISSVFPITHSASDLLISLGSQTQIVSSYNSLSYFLKQYTVSSFYGGLFALAYFLTPNGKNYYNNIHIIQGSLENFQVYKKNYKEELIPDEILNIYLEKLKLNKKKLNFDPFIPENTEEVPPRISALKYLIIITETLGYDKEIQKFVKASYNDYLLYTNTLDDYKTGDESNRFNWIAIGDLPKMIYLSDIALRLESCPTSEAAAERAIGDQRKIIQATRSSAKEDLVRARLTLNKI